MSAFVDNSVSKGTNINEFAHLPENVRTWTTGAPSIRRNPFSPVEMLSSGMMMARAQAAGMGKDLTRKEKRELGRQIKNYGEGRMFVYSPLGRGSIMT